MYSFIFKHIGSTDNASDGFFFKAPAATGEAQLLGLVIPLPSVLPPDPGVTVASYC
jgi:hypothetical protein